MTRIYLDAAATTPARPEAIAAMLPLLAGGDYNASALYAEGRAARAALDSARERVANALGAKPREIVFTSGGSESIALALLGSARARSAGPGHLITVQTEHHAVLHAVDVLAAEGWAVTRLPVDADGRIDPAAFAAAIGPATALVSIMLANNEIGTLAPIAELAAIARRAGALFHTDAIQAPAVSRLDVRTLGVDLLSIAGHKFGGPKGVGVLYVRTGTALAPLIVGGPQEAGRRAGTENVAGIAGLAAALACAHAEAPAHAARIGDLRDRLERGIVAGVPDVRINAAGSPRLPGISSIAFADVAGDALLIALDLAGIAASAGSACAAGSLEPSHVIEALDLEPRFRRGVIRFSLGHMTTAAEVAKVVAVMPQLVSEVRGVGSFV